MAGQHAPLHNDSDSDSLTAAKTVLNWFLLEAGASDVVWQAGHLVTGSSEAAKPR